ncbi:IclR family transcriptional regulator [Bradyrhizobium sacchari]|uniref:IclR family transcriptional regulator n=1 Tax=Bradyrhizobium sacchari TaxID=1399419 RepID=A0A560IPC5_9BRAD|nr:IclR family transcriptional regulator [Bradyrhizobium sacchari]TWB73929.1 IclR family transcriptional regulator [Bradyrhizobium sacchari]
MGGVAEGRAKRDQRAARSSGFRVPTVQKLGSLLQLFIPEAVDGCAPCKVCKLQDIARHLGWDDGTTHRFLVSLTEIGMLERTSDDRFRIGVLAMQLASVYVAASELRGVILEKIEELSAATRLTTEVGALQSGAMVVIASRQGSMPLTSRCMLGEKVPLHATAGGKAILSQLGDAEVEELCRGKLVGLASNTRTTLSSLMWDIGHARESGFVSTLSEYAEGLRSIAIPLPAGCFGTGPAALACSGPAILSGPGWEIAEEELRAFAATLPRGVA